MLFPTFTQIFFQVNIFVQMQVDKYLYKISENEIMFSSGSAKILEDVHVCIERCVFSTIIFILMHTACNYIQETDQCANYSL